VGAELPPLLDADHGADLVELGEPGVRLAAIATGGAGAAEIGFEDDDARLRRLLLDAERGPEAGEAAADDGDLGVLRPFERRRHRLGAGILQPEGAVGWR